jgi:hypothetical protein
VPFKDLDVYLEVARALIAGQNPYAVPEAYYPLPFYFIFVPLALIPPTLAHAVWTVVGASALIAVLRKRGALAVFFMPVLLAFLMGQIDLPMLGALALLRARRYGGIALGVLMLKPQLVLFIAPWQIWQWWHAEKKQIAACAATLAIFACAALALEPAWPANWLGLSGERLRAPLAPSLWGALAFIPGPMYWALGGTASAVALAWAYWRGKFDEITTVNFLVNPVIISYDLSLLALVFRGAREWAVLILVSYLAFAVSALGWWRGEGPFILTTVAALLMVVGARRKAGSSRAGIFSRRSRSNAVISST